MRISTDNYHIIGIVETWAREEIKDSELKIDGYEMFRKDRIFGKGGGIIVYVKETLKSTLCNDLMNTGFDESVWCNVRTGECNLLVGVCYRCPSSSQANNEKLLQLIESASLRKNVTNVLVMGDFNYPEIDYENGMVDAGSDSPPSKFFEKTQDMYWTQYVTEATRMRGMDDPSILDYVFTDEENLIEEVNCEVPLAKSDHVCLTWNLSVKTDQEGKTNETRLNYWKGNYDNIAVQLDGMDWEVEFAGRSLDDMWSVFKSKVIEISRSNVPLRRP
jgi:hypothetical protein